MANNDPGTPKHVVLVAVVRHISYATARAGPAKHARGVTGMVDVVVVVAVVHHISRATVRAGPSKHLGRLVGPHRIGCGPARPGCGPARPINFREGGQQPHPAGNHFRGWAAARPSPSHVQVSTARPGPAHHICKRLGPAWPGPSIFQTSRANPVRPITFSKVLGRSGPALAVACFRFALPDRAQTNGI